MAPVPRHKIVMVGAGGVGKTAITVQYIKHVFAEDYDPTLEDSHEKRTVIREKSCILDILDTAGQEEYAVLKEEYMRTGQGFALVFSVSDPDSFEEVKNCFKQIKRVKAAENDKHKYQDVPMVLLGNKCDLEGYVDLEQVNKFARDNGIRLYWTSAKTRLGIEEGFEGLVKEIRRIQKKNTWKVRIRNFLRRYHIYI